MKHETILLSHGSGGKLSHKLISDLFMKYFDNPILNSKTDSAILEIGSLVHSFKGSLVTNKQMTNEQMNCLAFTTDSYVVDPVFFPGGDIGKLAVCGTVNDLSVSGATPLYISSSFIIEEGFALDELETIVKSMAEEAKNAGVMIVTGDTKVVDKGKCDKIFINTSGIGLLDKKNKEISFGSDIKAGDKIIVNGFIGDHGIAILSARNSLNIKAEINSDCASLNSIIRKCLKVSDKIRFMRDATRGGVGTVLCELVENRTFGIEINETEIPVREEVRGICETLGFDPLFIANEGKVVIIVAEEDSEKILKELKTNELGKESKIIGEITTPHPGKLILNTEIGGKRIVDMIVGEQLPRIC
jgi:hydrogenase expression/formation protein HypE